MPDNSALGAGGVYNPTTIMFGGGGPVIDNQGNSWESPSNWSNYNSQHSFMPMSFGGSPTTLLNPGDLTNTFPNLQSPSVGAGGGNTMQGSNQYADFPTSSYGMSNMSGAGTPGMPSSGGSVNTPFGPGIVPPSSLPFNPVGTTGPQGTAAPNWPIAPSANNQYYAGYSYNPNFTANLYSLLQSQMGQGVTPFNLSTLLPSGGTTAPGTLTAPNNTILQNLFDFFSGNTNIGRPGAHSSNGGGTSVLSTLPGIGTLQSMSQTGNPIDQTPAWQAMVQAMQQQIQQQEANLKEQFNVGGGLVGSPYGNAVSNFESQTARDFNSQLLGAQTTALENAAQRQLTAGQDLSGMTTQLGSLFQGLDQQSIQNLLNEFIRTSPQNNPLLNLQYGLGTTFPAYLGKDQGLGGLGAVVGNIGSLASMVGGGISGGAAAAGGGIGDILAGILGGICYISRAIYGNDSPQVPVIRKFLVHWGARSSEGMKVLRWYVDNGPAIALMILFDKKLGDLYRPIFDKFYEFGLAEVV